MKKSLKGAGVLLALCFAALVYAVTHTVILRNYSGDPYRTEATQRAGTAVEVALRHGASLQAGDRIVAIWGDGWTTEIALIAVTNNLWNYREVVAPYSSTLMADNSGSGVGSGPTCNTSMTATGYWRWCGVTIEDASGSTTAGRFEWVHTGFDVSTSCG